MRHSDRGRQYAGADYQAPLAANGMTCGMSRAGDCWDNAPTASFWGTLKAELVDGERHAARAEARASIFEYVAGFDDRVRRHSPIGYVSPEAFEATPN